jgi:hypothetical protein
MGGAALLSIDPSSDGDVSESSSDCSAAYPTRDGVAARGRVRRHSLQSLQRKRSMSFDDAPMSPAASKTPPVAVAAPVISRPPPQPQTMRNSTMRLLPSGLSNSISAAVSLTADHGAGSRSRVRARSVGHVSLTLLPAPDGVSTSTSPLPLEERIAFKKWHL